MPYGMFKVVASFCLVLVAAAAAAAQTSPVKPEVSVRGGGGKYTLEFTEVGIEKFTGQLIFGVDHRPFEREFLKFRTPEEEKRLAVLHTSNINRRTATRHG